MAIYCIHCGTELPDSAQFCLTCGKPPRGDTSAPITSQVNTSAPNAGPLPARQKSRRTLWIVLAIIVVVLAVGTGGVVYLINQSSPSHTLQAICDDFKYGDYDALYHQLTPAVQNTYLEEQFDQGGQQIANSKGGVESCTVSTVSEQGASATGTIVLTYGNGSTETDTVQLVNENGTWKIQSLRG